MTTRKTTRTNTTSIFVHAPIKKGMKWQDASSKAVRPLVAGIALQPRSSQTKGKTINRKWNSCTKKRATGFIMVSAIHFYSMQMLIFSIENNRVSWLRVTFVWDTNPVIQDREPGEIDLHGLYVKEAITYADAALEEAKLRGDSEIRLIVGTCRSRKVFH